MPKSSITQCELVKLPKISDPRGNLTFIESGQPLGFDIKRVYYLYDVPGGADRGGHAHKELRQVIIALAGSFDITIDDGRKRKTIQLNRSFEGLKICPYIWRELNNFSSGAVCLVLASDHYRKSDYIRSYKSFLTLTNTKEKK